ncbi:folate-sensitive fragile site protein FRA10AC1 (macronuclear) [Tetrahymena thermophila SB210]|uniref:Folate-sensitive fragile site protein FRA10AC1 n=1 Tax=Tetrahymena thermophila (strain SB210) TaxID=312017 RepID=Q23NJ8_TETTS|nr:folate-sensitive fragile site protein FRA10AC1 [Tetrahymena thermophila SB210]EAR98076.2 folate-sensitive fragile site protein FRA10AC1 [Tetrahymena thermophila SB210]|eukprot:XP_001018321.2 folate-sensitive fragile site protein FRA10AC1 [Tetrahymena thermophila SB210]
MKSSNQTQIYKSDFQILKEHHKFLRDDEKDSQIQYSNPTQEQYGEILAKKYYEKLYKEYAIIDLSRYETGQIGMRWQTKDEVIIGKGIVICSNKKCTNTQNLDSYEVNFAYVEDNEKKNALVKVRVCQECVLKLNYKKQHQKVEDKNFEHSSLTNQQQQPNQNNEQSGNLKQLNEVQQNNQHDKKQKKTENDHLDVQRKIKKDKKKKKKHKHSKNDDEDE